MPWPASEKDHSLFVAFDLYRAFAAIIQCGGYYCGGPVCQQYRVGGGGLHFQPGEPDGQPVPGLVRGGQRGGGPALWGEKLHRSKRDHPYGLFPEPDSGRDRGHLWLLRLPHHAGVDGFPCGGAGAIHPISAHFLPEHPGQHGV